MQTRLELLIEDFEHAIEHSTIEEIELHMSLPYADTLDGLDYCELIVVPRRYFKQKLEYIKQMYTEDLFLKNNNKVLIIHWELSYVFG